jgi:hypothetical protein
VLEDREVATTARSPAIFSVQSPCSTYVCGVCPDRKQPLRWHLKNTLKLLILEEIFGCYRYAVRRLLQKSKVASVRIFGETLKREPVDDSDYLSRATEVAHEFCVRR